EFLGRIDRQVKIRGFRIEPGEIENALTRCPGVKEAAVIVSMLPGGDKHLCAYVVLQAKEDFDYFDDAQDLIAHLTAHLSKSLPQYLVPSVFMELPGIPLTSNGKLDRKALPAPEMKDGGGYTPPDNHMEKALVDIWTGVLFGDSPPQGDSHPAIGIDDDFFRLGGHSLKATVMTAKVHKETGVNIPLPEVFRTPTIRALADYIMRTAGGTYAAIEAVEKREYYPLSAAQKRMYILQQLNPLSSAYNISEIIPLAGEPDRDKLEQTIHLLIERHESFRTSFHMLADSPVQRVHDYWLDKDGRGPFHHTLRLSPSTGSSPETGLTEMFEDFVRPFDLSRAPLVRMELRRMPQEQYVLLLDMHHIITDGVSQEIVKKDFTTLYSEAENELPPLRIQYKDFSHWQNNRKQQEAVLSRESWWLNELAGELPVLDLPTDFPRPAVRSFEGDSVDFQVPQAVADLLKTVAAGAGSTLFIHMAALYTLLIAKLSGSEELIVGTPVAGRRHDDLENVVGMFVNTLPLRNFPAGQKTLDGFLTEVKNRTLEAFENQEYQLEDMVEKLDVPRNPGRNPIFDTLFTFYTKATPAPAVSPGDTPEAGEMQSPDPDFNRSHSTSKFDLSLYMTETPGGFSCTFEYCVKLFKRETVHRFARHFNNLLGFIIDNPRTVIWAVDILSAEEKEQVLYDFNRTVSQYPGDKSIVEIFREEAERHPRNTAVVVPWVQPHRSVTYETLNSETDRLARKLVEKGVRTGAIVAVIMERSLEMIIATLAVMKAAGAYLPVDSTLPGERIRYMCAESNAKLLLTAGHLSPIIQEITADPHVSLYNISRFLDSHGVPGSQGVRTDRDAGDHSLPPLPQTRTDDLAYVIYTSGSTGTPKGTLVNHRNAVRVVKHTNYIDIQPGDRVLQLSNYAFDVSVFDIFGALLNGASLVLVDKETVGSPVKLSRLIEEAKITLFFITPSLFNALTDGYLHHFESVRKVIVGGERLSVKHTRKALEILGPGRIINGYGPTEAAVFATSHLVDSVPDRAENIPIGSPITNTTVYILDKYLAPVPIGVNGEICIGGDAVARGYLNNPQLTAEKFVRLPSPSGNAVPAVNAALHQAAAPSSILYRTGDLGRRLPDGTIDCLGRIDRQVKIRGFRIEPGEIENALTQCPGVKEAAVTISRHPNGDAFLCAYVVTRPDEMLDKTAGSTGAYSHSLSDADGNIDVTPYLTDHLSQSLPQYMIPSYFVPLQSLPLTTSKKVDYKKLPLPKIGSSTNEYAPPRNRTEAKLRETWSELLAVPQDQIGIDNNFFKLGGHSLKATIMIARIHKEFDSGIPLAEVFKNPTIRGMAQYIQENDKEKYVSMEPVEKKEYYAVSSPQKRLYLLQQMAAGNTGYNMPNTIIPRERIDKAKLESIFQKLIARHESLRTSFHIVHDLPVQRIHEKIDFQIECFSAADHEADTLIDGFTRPFDLSKPPLLRVALVEIEPSHRQALLIDMHHIITDGTSQEILEKEFTALYAGEGLPDITLQYRDFSEWRNSGEQQEIIKQQESYWTNEFSGEIPVLDLPTDYPRPVVYSFEGAGVDFMLSGADSRALRSLAGESDGTLFMVVLAIYTILLSKLSGREDIVVGIPIAARRYADLQNIIGMFVNTLAMRNYPEGDKTFYQFLTALKERVMKAFEHQEFQFEELVEKLSLPGDAGRNPVFDVMLNLGNQAEDTGKVSDEPGPDFQDSPYQHKKSIAKFDLT
ncbi:MAG: amino acid adenylation domain-containing protein, partial [bacterium]|nr:amino acid adenylation domain-containing protein [bacterium]